MQSVQRYRKHRSSTVRRLFITIELVFLICVAALFFGLGGIILWASVIPMPSINSFQSRAVSNSTKIYDRTGTIVLYDVNGAVRRTAVPLANISPYIREATISIEDRTFYNNVGIRPLSIARAIWVNIMSGGYSQGASTITQQVVKNALLTQNKTMVRKIEEIILAVRLTQTYSKDDILNTYLNESPYGGTIYGVEEASETYFGLSAKNVDLAQAAYLAALPQAPTYYSPYGNHRSDLDARKDLVLTQMKDAGYITDDQYQQAKQEIVTFKPQGDTGIKAPHFVFYILEYLENTYGVDAVSSGGLRVVTTLDYDLQQKIEQIVSKDTPDMLKQFNASNAGAVVLDPKTGQILAMIGSKGYFDTSIDGQVNTATALRQPGSSFKPIVYAAALQKGYTPDTVVFDVQTQFSTACSPSDIANDVPPCYSPQNYDGSFKGPMTFRDALAQSENIPAIKVLYLVGIPTALQQAQTMGITSLGDPDQYGLTLVLGGGEVSLLEMAGAYGIFADDGIRNPTTGILQVQDGAENILESYQSKSSRVMDAQIARQISDMLSDNQARIPEFGVDSPLNFASTSVAVKTGTTNDSRDAWVIGYSSSVVVATWAGNNDNTPMVKKIAAFILAPMWHEIMQTALNAYPAEDFPKPASEDTSSFPAVLTGNWNSHPSQGVHDILYWVKKDDPQSGAPSNPWSDPQSAYWDFGVQSWLAHNPAAAQYIQPTYGGTTYIQEPTQTTQPFTITSPTNGTVLSSLSSFTIISSGDASEVRYSINGIPVGSSNKAPFAVTVTSLPRGSDIITAVAQTPSGVQTQQVTFTVQ